MAEEIKKEQAVKAAAKPEAKGPKKYTSTVNVGDATPAQVVKVFKKVGIYGECYQVLVRVLGGRDQGSLLRRNVRGPVRENDLLMLKETERDVRAV
jgi:small subunit ribosomal protein S28e